MKINKKKILSDSAFLTIGNLIINLRGIIFIPIIVGTVGMSNYGVFIQVIINSQVLVPLTTLALGMGFYRYTSKLDDSEIFNLSKDYWSVIFVSFILSFIGAAVVYATAPLVNNYILDGTALATIRLSSLLVITGSLITQNSKYIVARKYMKLYSLYKVAIEFIPYMAFIFGIVIKSDLFFGLLLYIIFEGILLLFNMIWITRRLKIVAPSLKVIIKFIKYSWSLCFSEITGGLLSKVDRYFIGYFMGPIAIGIYNIVYSVCSVLHVFTEPFRKYLATYMPKLWDSDKIFEVKEQVRSSLRYYLILAFGALVGIVFLLKPLIKLILHRDLSSIPNFNVLVLAVGLGILGYGISEIFFIMFQLKERNHLKLIFQLIAVTLNVALNVILIKQFGITGAGIATFISYFAVVLLCNSTIHIKYPLKFFYKLGGMIISVSLAGLFLYRFPVNSFSGLIVNSFVYLCIYFLLILAMRVVSFSEIKGK